MKPRQASTEAEFAWTQIEAAIRSAVGHRPKNGAANLIEFLAGVRDQLEALQGGVAGVPEELLSLPNRVTELEARVANILAPTSSTIDDSEVVVDTSAISDPVSAPTSNPFSDVEEVDSIMQPSAAADVVVEGEEE